MWPVIPRFRDVPRMLFDMWKSQSTRHHHSTCKCGRELVSRVSIAGFLDQARIDYNAGHISKDGLDRSIRRYVRLLNGECVACVYTGTVAS